MTSPLSLAAVVSDPTGLIHEEAGPIRKRTLPQSLRVNATQPNSQPVCGIRRVASWLILIRGWQLTGCTQPSLIIHMNKEVCSIE